MLGSSRSEEAPLGPVHVSELELDPGSRVGIHAPARMIDGVAQEAAPSIPPVSPRVLLEEVRRPGLGGRLRRASSVDGDALPAAPARKLVDNPDPVRGRLGDASERRGLVRLVLEQPRHERHRSARNELANEHDTTAVPFPDVEAQVHLGKVPQSRPGDAADARVPDIEGDEAHEGLPLPAVEDQAGRQARRQDRVRDGVREEGEVDPARGQERAPRPAVARRRRRRLGRRLRRTQALISRT